MAPTNFYGPLNPIARFLPRNTKDNKSFSGRIAVVCGGSKGIGKATACEIVRRGGSVCLIARNNLPLEEAAEEMRGFVDHETQFVDTILCDTTDMERLEPELAAFVNRRGVPDYLLNIVGYAYPHYIQNLTLDDFRRNMDVNYYGQLVPILVLLPYFMKAKKGYIANASSMAGTIGAIGYASYAPTKAAITGLSEALRNELKPYNIQVSVLFPPDTDTPGFVEENRTKPEEIHLMIDGWSRLHSAEEVAEAFVEGLLHDRFEILVGDQWLLRTASRLAPGLVRFMADRELASAQKKLNGPGEPDPRGSSGRS